MRSMTDMGVPATRMGVASATDPAAATSPSIVVGVSEAPQTVSFQSMADHVTLELAGREVRLSNPQKVVAESPDGLLLRVAQSSSHRGSRPIG